MGKNKSKAKGNKNNKGNNNHKKINSNDIAEIKASRKRRNRENNKKVAAQNFGKFAQQVINLGLRIKGIYQH